MSLLVSHMNMDPSRLRNGRAAWRGPPGAGETEQRSKGELQPYLQQCTDAGFDVQVSEKGLWQPSSCNEGCTDGLCEHTHCRIKDLKLFKEEPIGLG